MLAYIPPGNTILLRPYFIWNHIDLNIFLDLFHFDVIYGSSCILIYFLHMVDIC